MGKWRTQRTLSPKHVKANFSFPRAKNTFSGTWGGSENIADNYFFHAKQFEY